VLPLADPENQINGNSMNPSSRTTALNIVADMLRKLNVSPSENFEPSMSIPHSHVLSLFSLYQHTPSPPPPAYVFFRMFLVGQGPAMSRVRKVSLYLRAPGDSAAAAIGQRVESLSPRLWRQQ